MSDVFCFLQVTNSLQELFARSLATSKTMAEDATPNDPPAAKRAPRDGEDGHFSPALAARVFGGDSADEAEKGRCLQFMEGYIQYNDNIIII